MLDKYDSFSELARHETAGKDYEVITKRTESTVVIVAPHGGGIERGTAELAELAAGPDHNLFMLRGLKLSGNGDLHITSTRFDHVDCVALVSQCRIAVGIHGCRGDGQIYVGGLDDRLAGLIVSRLMAVNMPATTDCPSHLAGKERRNICNRTIDGRGAQLEITTDLRMEPHTGVIAAAVRDAIGDHFLISA